MIQLLNGIVGPIGEISTYLGEIAGSKSLANSYYDVTPDEGGVSSITPSENSVKLNDVSFAYDEGKNPVLTHINMKFDKGGTYAIVGKSGCGKSTLAKIIAGILPDYDGSIFLGSRNIKEFNPQTYASQVRYVHQNPFLFKMSIRDNVKMGKKADDIESVMKNLDLDELLSYSEDDLICNRDKISGGQKSRVSIARSIVALPKVLILDEPTANLDLATAIKTIEYLKTFGITLIIVTHETDETLIGLFDSVVQM